MKDGAGLAMLVVFFMWLCIFVHCLRMFYSSEVSQTFYAVISLHLAVVACLPTCLLHTGVSRSPCTCNSCDSVLPILVEILRDSVKPATLILSLPNSTFLAKTLHLILQQELLCLRPLILLFLHPNLPHFSALSLLPLSAQRSCQQGEERVSHSDFSSFSPFPVWSGRCVRRHQRHVENVSTSGKPSIKSLRSIARCISVGNWALQSPG